MSARFGAALALVLATTAALSTKPVFAEPKVEDPNARSEAATRFRKGLDLFKDGDYQAARAEFRRAYELAPNYQVLYNIGQVSFQLQDYPGALLAFQRYLNEGDRAIPAPRRADVMRDIDKLRQRVANLDVVVNVPDADVTIDEANVGKTPLRMMVLVGAGKHRVVVSRPGYDAVTKVVEIASQETQRVVFELTETAAPTPPPPPPAVLEAPKVVEVPPPPPAPPPPPPERRSNLTRPIIAWSTTGALAVGAAVTGVIALDASSDLKDIRTHSGATRDALDSASSRTKTFALVTDILGGTAIAAGGVSIYLTINAFSTPPPTTGTQSLRLAILPGGAALTTSF